MNWRPRACPACRKTVIYARTEHLKWQLLDPVPNPDGNVHAYEMNGNWYARSVPPRTPAAPPDQLFMPHAATCAGASPKPEKPAPPPDNVTALDTWRRAASKHAKQKRRRKPKQQDYRPGMNVRKPGGAS